MYTKIPPEHVEVLDREEVAYRVCRWIAWGKRFQDRAIRLGLALHLRYEATTDVAGRRSPSGWAWPIDPILGRAEKLFKKTKQYQQLVRRGGVLDDHGRPAESATLILPAWDRIWPIVQEVIASADRNVLVQQAKAAAATRKKRHKPKPRKPLSPAQLAVVGALDTLKRAVIQGVSLESLPATKALAQETSRT